MRPTLITGKAAPKGQHHRHLQQHAEGVADVVGAELREALGAIAALEQKSLAVRHLAQRLGQPPGLAGEDQRRIGPQLGLDGRQMSASG